MNKFSAEDWKKIRLAVSALTELCLASLGVMSMNRLFPRKHFLGKVANFGLGYFIGYTVKIALADMYADATLATGKQIETLRDNIDHLIETFNEVKEA